MDDLRRMNRGQRFCDERIVDEGFAKSESWTNALRIANRGRRFCEERIVDKGFAKVDEGFAKSESWTKVLRRWTKVL